MQERILELRFDNVIRVNVEGPEHVKGTSRQQVELRDSKSKEGLADEYAKDYHAAVSGVTEDRHAKTRAVRFQLFKLDVMFPQSSISDAVAVCEVKNDPALACLFGLLLIAHCF